MNSQCYLPVKSSGTHILEEFVPSEIRERYQLSGSGATFGSSPGSENSTVTSNTDIQMSQSSHSHTSLAPHILSTNSVAETSYSRPPCYEDVIASAGIGFGSDNF